MGIDVRRRAVDQLLKLIQLAADLRPHGAGVQFIDHTIEREPFFAAIDPLPKIEV